MKAIVSKYVNIRTGRPEIQMDNNPGYYFPGDEVEIVDTVVGDSVNGNKVWFKLNNGSFLTSEAVPNYFPWWILDFGINELWNYTRGENVTVIFIDSGFANCDDIPIDKVSILSVNDNSKGLDNIGHGTLMTSIIAGTGKHIEGVSKGINIIALKITDVKDEISTQGFIRALDKIASLVDRSEYYVVNCSFRLSLDISEDDHQTIQSMINKLSTDYKIIFVAAVGNDSQDTIRTVPASLDNVISCAGISNEDIGIYFRLSKSNYWDGINLTAPATFPSKHLTNIFPLGVAEQGSSHACAFTAGIISLIISRGKQKNKDIDYNFVSNFIEKSSVSVNSNKGSYQILNRKLLLQNFKNI